MPKRKSKKKSKKFTKAGSYSTRPQAHAKALKEKNKGKSWKIRKKYEVYSK